MTFPFEQIFHRNDPLGAPEYTFPQSPKFLSDAILEASDLLSCFTFSFFLFFYVWIRLEVNTPHFVEFCLQPVQAQVHTYDMAE